MAQRNTCDRDIAVLAKAYATRPGDARWSAVADVNVDFKCDGKDIARVAKMLGWHA